MRVALALACALGIGIGLAVDLGCGHDAKPAVQPDEHPPLPPGTPIGYLIDDASELQLRDEQVTRLKVIDSDLAAHLDVLDARQHGPAAAPARGSAGGRHRGGRRGGGMRRGGAGGGSGGTGGGTGSAAAQPAASPGGTATAASGKTEERADDVRAAIAQALAVLDPAQQAIAKRVLSDHGVDVDAGRAEPGHPEAEPDEPDEPGTGSDRN